MSEEPDYTRTDEEIISQQIREEEEGEKAYLHDLEEQAKHSEDLEKEKDYIDTYHNPKDKRL